MAALKFLQGVASVGMKGISKANKYFKDKAEKRRYEKSQKEYERITNAVAAKRRKEKAEAEIAEYDKKLSEIAESEWRGTVLSKNYKSPFDEEE